MTRHQTSDIRHQTKEGSQLTPSIQKFCGLWSVVCGLMLTGCVHRQLTIRSEPPGAAIFMNDKRVGVTPHTYDFVWYGWYRLALEKPGYERLDDRVLIKAPFYLWIPLDFVIEALPVTIRDAKALSYQLVPSTPLYNPTPPVMEHHAKPPKPSKESPHQHEPAASQEIHDDQQSR